MLAHSHHLWDYGFAGPVDAEDFSQLLKILRGCFSNGEDSVSEPTHAQGAEFLVEELHAELAGEQRNVLNNSQPDPPLLVLG